MEKYIIGRKFSSFFKPQAKGKIAQLLAFAGVDTNSNVWVGSRILTVLLVFIVGALIPFSIIDYIPLEGIPLLSEKGILARVVIGFVVGAVFAGVVSVFFYLHLYYLIADRTKRVERILPDFLLMVSANLRSGMTPYAAFQSSARPEFGPLQSEISYVSSRSLGIESFSESIEQLTSNIDSAILRRMVGFFENGLKSGGKLAYLLETSAEEIRENDEMKNQMVINTKTYAVFLVFILIFGLPLLLSISTQFLTVFTKIQANLSDGSATTPVAGLSSPKLKFDIGFIDQLTYVIIIFTSIMTGVLVGVIAEGKLLIGLKYAPPLAFGACFMFLIFKMVISGFIGALG